MRKTLCIMWELKPKKLLLRYNRVIKMGHFKRKLRKKVHIWHQLQKRMPATSRLLFQDLVHPFTQKQPPLPVKKWTPTQCLKAKVSHPVDNNPTKMTTPISPRPNNQQAHNNKWPTKRAKTWSSSMKNNEKAINSKRPICDIEIPSKKHLTQFFNE